MHWFDEQVHWKESILKVADDNQLEEEIKSLKDKVKELQELLESEWFSN